MEVKTEITVEMDRELRETMADALADKFDEMNVDWENDDEMLEYYVDCMKRIWNEKA